MNRRSITVLVTFSLIFLGALLSGIISLILGIKGVGIKWLTISAIVLTIVILIIILFFDYYNTERRRNDMVTILRIDDNTKLILENTSSISEKLDYIRKYK